MRTLSKKRGGIALGAIIATLALGASFLGGAFAFGGRISATETRVETIGVRITEFEKNERELSEKVNRIDKNVERLIGGLEARGYISGISTSTNQ